MGKVEDIIESQLTELRAKFRPTFGNLKHIDIVKSTAKLDKLEKELKVKLDQAKDAKLLKQEIQIAKRNLLYNFKNL